MHACVCVLTQHAKSRHYAHFVHAKSRLPTKSRRSLCLLLVLASQFLEDPDVFLGKMEIRVHWLFYRKFNSEQFLLEAFVMGAEKTYTKLEFSFWGKVTLKCWRRKYQFWVVNWNVLRLFQITFLSRFWTNSSNLDWVTVWKICFVDMSLCTFLTNQSQTEVISSQMDSRMLISVKNRFRIIQTCRRAQNFFSKCSSKNFDLDFLKMSFFNFQTSNFYKSP